MSNRIKFNAVNKVFNMHDLLLHEIFKFLHIVDLNNIANTCKQFRHLKQLQVKEKYSLLICYTSHIFNNFIANNKLILTFSRGYHNYHLNLPVYKCNKVPDNYKIIKHYAEQTELLEYHPKFEILLPNIPSNIFGLNLSKYYLSSNIQLTRLNKLKTLCLSNVYFDDNNINLLNGNLTLKSLYINASDITHIGLKKLLHGIKSLETVGLRKCFNASNFNNVFDTNLNITTLIFNESCIESFKFLNVLTKLRKLHLSNTTCYINADISCLRNIRILNLINTIWHTTDKPNLIHYYDKPIPDVIDSTSYVPFNTLLPKLLINNIKDLSISCDELRTIKSIPNCEILNMHGLCLLTDLCDLYQTHKNIKKITFSKTYLNDNSNYRMFNHIKFINCYNDVLTEFTKEDCITQILEITFTNKEYLPKLNIIFAPSIKTLVLNNYKYNDFENLKTNIHLRYIKINNIVYLDKAQFFNLFA
jgi:hypothetical protein